MGSTILGADPLMSWAGTHYLASGVDINDPRLSQLRAPDLSGLPPALIQTAGFDLLRDEGKAYAEALERAGVKVHHVCHEHMIHHFYAIAGAIPYARTALKAVGADIQAALGPVKALSAVLHENEPQSCFYSAGMFSLLISHSVAPEVERPALAHNEAPPAFAIHLAAGLCLGLEALVSQARQDLPASLLPIGPP